MYLRMPSFRQAGLGARATHLELELYLTVSNGFDLCVTLLFLFFFFYFLSILYRRKPENRASAKKITYSWSHSQQVAEPQVLHLSAPSPSTSTPLLPLCLTRNALKTGSGFMHTHFICPNPLPTLRKVKPEATEYGTESGRCCP